METRTYFFTQQVIKMWNLLPKDVVMATGIDSFKRELDRFMEGKAMVTKGNVHIQKQ